MATSRIDPQSPIGRVPPRGRNTTAGTRQRLFGRDLTVRANARAQSVLKRLGGGRLGSASRRPVLDRRVRGGKTRERADIESADEYFDMLDEGTGLHARKSLEQSCLNGDNPRQSARQWFEYPAEQYAALEKVLESSGVSNDPVVRARLEDALAELLAEHGDAIHATINSARAATEFAEITQGGASDARALTHAYDDIVFDPERNLARVLNLVVERFPGRPLSGAISAIRRALGDDLSARRQSAPDERLRLLVSDLYYVSVATTVLLTCTQLAERISAQSTDGASAQDLTDEVLMRRIAHWTIDRWLPSSRVTELVDMLPDDGVAARITLMSGLRRITAALPDQLFIDKDHRFLVTDTVQQVLDEIIDVEMDDIAIDDAFDDIVGMAPSAPIAAASLHAISTHASSSPRTE
ncbi:TyeA family type III secretion system gatekeeper subunit [Pandoraea pnomenusa]|nr:TyeA family type III secretion system gatekeeper subunit [Pandoraea pnomenusa]